MAETAASATPRATRLITASLILLLYASHHTAATTRILTYNVTYVSATNTTYANDSWVTFDSAACFNGEISSSSYDDDSTSLDPLPYTAPFFAVENASWYINSNGFLALVPYAMCSVYCYYDTEGNYSFSETPTGVLIGGDWPMIALYNADLNPPASGSNASIRKYVGKKYADNIQVAVVDYVNVTAWGAEPGNAFTAQVELWPNGTIIFRYRSVMAPSATWIPPSVGLVLDNNQFVVAQVPQASADIPTNIIAIRFDPLTDPCVPYSACGSCLSAYFSAAAAPSPSACVWCAATNECIHNGDVTLSICPASQIRNITCVAPVNADDGSQIFYDVVAATATNASFPGDITAAARPSSLGWATVNVDSTTAILPLPFNMTYFDFPLDPSPSSVSLTSTGDLYLSDTNGALYFVPATSCSLRGLGCVLPGAVAFDASMSVTEAFWAPLGPRPIGGVFCPSILADSDGVCGPGAAIDVGLQRAAMPLLGLTVRYVVTERGAIAMSYTQSSWFNTTAGMWQSFNASVYPMFPAALTGVIADSASGGVSAFAPWTLVSQGSLLVFQPHYGCYNCGAGGACMATNLTCQCPIAFTGPDCALCSSGYFGSDCASCPNCTHGGSCDDGVDGSGACICVDPWSGPLCSVLCPSSAPRPLDVCPGCNPSGGSCTCGECSCHSFFGWTGPNCTQWVDPCLSSSFDGCAVCVTNPYYVCNYCMSPDFRCIAAPDQQGMTGAPFSSCEGGSTVIADASADQCTGYVYDGASSGPFITIVIAASLALTGVLLCLITAVAKIFTHTKLNPLIEHTVDSRLMSHGSLNQTRVVVRVESVTAASKARVVHGFPLKQLPLRKLNELQNTPYGNPVHLAVPPTAAIVA